MQGRLGTCTRADVQQLHPSLALQRPPTPSTARYLDTRLEEYSSMPRRGWESRLALAAKAIDRRLKAEPMQTICHGDIRAPTYDLKLPKIA